jgi:predicted dithiol-disulfide oxidoreductase (DUF899 family)
MTAYAESIAQIEGYRRKIEALHKEMREVQAVIEPQPVADYAFTGQDGPVSLSDLFGDKDDLFVIHNMGTGCAYCTMWADGFNGVYDHMADRAAFVVSSPNSPEVQKDFAAGRGWRFPMVSHAGGSFAEDMGYKTDKGWWPGVSVFKKTDAGIVRVSNGQLGPGDDFCSVWHFLDMLPEGSAGWGPKFSYA